MTVQEMIDALMKIEDKTQSVYYINEDTAGSSYVSADEVYESNSDMVVVGTIEVI